MKKFNSFFAIATVALTSVFGFTSCDKNDDSINNAATPVQPKQEQKAQENSSALNYFGAQLFINDDVFEYGDFVITVNYDGKSEEYKVSEGQTVTLSAEQINKALGGYVQNYPCDSYSGKMLTIPNFKAASGTASFDVKFVPNQTAFDNLKPETKLTAIILPSFVGSANNNVTPNCLTSGNTSVSTKDIKTTGSGTIGIGIKSDRIMSNLTRKANLLCSVIK